MDVIFFYNEYEYCHAKIAKEIPNIIIYMDFYCLFLHYDIHIHYRKKQHL